MRPTWETVLDVARDDPAFAQAVQMTTCGVARETAMIALALWQYEQLTVLRAELLDIKQHGLPPIIVDGRFLTPPVPAAAEPPGE